MIVMMVVIIKMMMMMTHYQVVNRQHVCKFAPMNTSEMVMQQHHGGIGHIDDDTQGYALHTMQLY